MARRIARRNSLAARIHYMPGTPGSYKGPCTPLQDKITAVTLSPTASAAAADAPQSREPLRQ